MKSVNAQVGGKVRPSPCTLGAGTWRVLKPPLLLELQRRQVAQRGQAAQRRVDAFDVVDIIGETPDLPLNVGEVVVPVGSLRARNELSLFGSICYSEGRRFRCAGWVVQQRAQRIRRSPYPDDGYAKKIRLRQGNESIRRDNAGCVMQSLSLSPGSMRRSFAFRPCNEFATLPMTHFGSGRGTRRSFFISTTAASRAAGTKMAREARGLRCSKPGHAEICTDLRAPTFSIKK